MVRRWGSWRMRPVRKRLSTYHKRRVRWPARQDRPRDGVSPPPKAIFHFGLSRDHPAPHLHFGSFKREDLAKLPLKWGGDIDFYAARPLPGQVPKGQAMKASHCRIPPTPSPFRVVVVKSGGLYFIIAVIRKKAGWGTALEDQISRDGSTLVGFFEGLRGQFKPQKRSSVDYSDGRAMLVYGWCYFSSWNNGCVHKKSFKKDWIGGQCSPNLDLQMLGLKTGHSLSDSLQEQFAEFCTVSASETGSWVENSLAGTTEVRPQASAHCTHTPHFTTFTLALDAKQFTHRDRHNQSFTNILNFCDPSSVYFLGLANYCLEDCHSCDSLALAYGDGDVCSVFSQDHDHFVDRIEGPGRRVALLFYSHRLHEELHGQKGQIQFWKNVVRVREEVLARMQEEKAHSVGEIEAVRSQFRRLLLGVKDPDRASTEEGCLELMAEMSLVKQKRDLRKLSKP